MLCLELSGHGDAFEEKSNDAIPDLSSVTRLPPADISTGEDDVDSARIEARQYLEFITGYRHQGEYLGYGAEGIIYIFLFDFTRQTRCAPMDMGNRG